jgi:tetratricopeptide (TPR) repeat protein
LHIWRPALEIIKANPIFGVGLDTFKIAFPFYSGIEFNQIDGLFMSSRMAHNELLQIAATSGLVGLAAYLAFLISFALCWWKTYQTTGAHGRWVLIALLSCAVAYQVQNLFSFGVAAINFIWFFLLAAVVTYNKSPQTTETLDKHSILSFYFHKLITCVLLLLILFFPIRRLAADIAYGRSDIYSAAVKNRDSQTTAESLTYYSDAEIHYLNRALDIFPWDVKYNLYTGQAYEQRARLDSPKPDWFLNALRYYQIAVQMSPANAYYYNDEGRVYNALSAFGPYQEKAEQAYGQAVHFSPASPYFILNWMTSLEKVGKTKEAQKEMQKAFDSDSTFSAKILSQMAFEKYQAGDKAGAFRYVNLAAQGNTLSAEAYYCRGIIYLSEKEKKKALNDFLYVQSLNPDPFKNSSVQHLDELIQESQK